MLEADLKAFLEHRDSTITHYVIYGTMQGKKSGVAKSITLADEERFRQLLRYDQAGRIRGDFESNPIRLFITPLPNDKGVEPNEFASNEFAYVAGLLGFPVEICVEDMS